MSEKEHHTPCGRGPECNIELICRCVTHGLLSAVVISLVCSVFFTLIDMGLFSLFFSPPPPIYFPMLHLLDVLICL